MATACLSARSVVGGENDPSIAYALASAIAYRLRVCRVPARCNGRESESIFVLSNDVGGENSHKYIEVICNREEPIANSQTKKTKKNEK